MESAGSNVRANHSKISRVRAGEATPEEEYAQYNKHVYFNMVYFFVHRTMELWKFCVIKLIHIYEGRLRSSLMREFKKYHLLNNSSSQI